MKIYKDVFNKVIELDNLFSAWNEFKKGKRSRLDVMSFEYELEREIFSLHEELTNQCYKHGGYTGFFISDPKRRHIHKAIVRDRVVHHAVFSILNPLFENMFIPQSFSCRVGKGSHKGVEIVAKMLNKASQNNSRVCYALKCDIQKFFDNIDHKILLSFLSRRMRDEKMMWLLRELVESYESGITRERERERERESWRYAPQRNTYRKPYVPAFC
jgi:retron-type reverse transcriptase